MYSVFKYLVMNIINNRSYYNEHSGGFPHSEIHGSKHILGSPWLIAEYHVFHRLLLPRHPPNALLALDLIQKETDCSFHSLRGYMIAVKHQAASRKTIYKRSFRSKANYPMLIRRSASVSVLDLDNSVRFSKADRGSVEETT